MGIKRRIFKDKCGSREINWWFIGIILGYQIEFKPNNLWAIGVNRLTLAKQ